MKPNMNLHFGRGKWGISPLVIDHTHHWFVVSELCCTIAPSTHNKYLNLRFDFLYACSVGHIRTAACVPDGIVIVLFRYYSGMM